MEVDSWVREGFWPALVGSLAAFAYLSVLARAHLRARLLVALAREAGRRRRRQEELRSTWGFAPRLDYYRRLEQDLMGRLRKERIRV
jgi:DNA-binding response OmpR family regulator